MNKEVSYKLAVLLKEKGYNISTGTCYFNSEFFSSENLIPLKYPKLKGKEYKEKVSNKLIFAPTIAEVIMWILKKYNIWIEVFCPKSYHTSWYGLVKVVNSSECHEHCTEECNTPIEVYEKAIEHILKNNQYDTTRNTRI